MALVAPGVEALEVLVAVVISNKGSRLHAIDFHDTNCLQPFCGALGDCFALLLLTILNGLCLARASSRFKNIDTNIGVRVLDRIKTHVAASQQFVVGLAAFGRLITTSWRCRRTCRSCRSGVQ